MIIQGKVASAIAYASVIEQEAVDQIRRMCDYDCTAGSTIRIMPDVHSGKGCTIGTTMTIRDKAVPNVVGVDIGCGMYTLYLNEAAVDFPRFDEATHFIPSGMHVWEGRKESFDLEALRCFRALKDTRRLQRSLGTLGGGNHFIELQKDEEGTLWIMIHSGSRNLGARVGEHYNKIARDLNEKWHSVVKPELRLSFLPRGTKEFEMYWNEMRFCIDFAFCNRRLMMQRIEEVIADALPGIEFEPMINIAHNYAAFEHHYGEDVIVHRKGATLAREGIVGIIPGSQGTASYIVEGLGNPESFCSCSHGAGRVMSRTAAIKTLDMAAEVAQLEAKGIVHAIRCQDDMQEASGAYKDIETVIKNELDLVKIKTRLLPIAVIKG